MKFTLACFILIWSVQAEVGNTLKCWDCATLPGLPENRKCPDDSRDTTRLIECKHDFCMSSNGTTAGKKLAFLSVSTLSVYNDI